MSNKKNLPTIAELTADPVDAYKKDQFTLLVNQQPPASWVKNHPYISGYKYLPIDKIELMLKRLFRDYRIEVLEQGQLLNSVYSKVRVHYLHPVSNEWTYHDGVGAQELQTKQETDENGKKIGSLPLKMDGSNLQRGAVTMALPISKTTAIKDACDHIGDIFGANLNRKDIQPYTANADFEQLANGKPVLNGDDLKNAKKALDKGEISMDKLNELWTIDEKAEEVLYA